MKKEDLMIGDWVNIQTEKDDEPMYSQVEQLWECEIDADFQTDYKNVHPIPLTKEIMEKNGFNLYPEETNVFYLNAGYRHDLDTVCLYIGDIERPSIYGNDSLGEKIYVVLHCKYVHEFQHILKMCGIEKEIIL